jgi:hypothetical protein
MATTQTTMIATTMTRCHHHRDKGSRVAAIASFATTTMALFLCFGDMTTQNMMAHAAKSPSEGQIVYATNKKGGTQQWEGHDGLRYKPATQTLQTENLDAKHFVGSYLDLHGASLLNAALVNATLEDLTHLTLESLAVTSLAPPRHMMGGVSGAAGQDDVSVMVVSNARGLLSSVPRVRWDYTSAELKVSALSSFGQQNRLKLNANVDFGGHELSKFVVCPNTVIGNVTLDHVTIVNSVLMENVTALANSLHLRDAVMDSLTIQSLSNVDIADQGYLLTIAKDGKVAPLQAIQVKVHKDNDNGEGSSSASASTVIVQAENGMSLTRGHLDLHHNELRNANVTSGNIHGTSIDVKVRSVAAREMRLMLPDDDNDKSLGSASKGTSASLVMMQRDGNLQPLGRAIELSQDGDSIQSSRISGTLDFGPTPPSRSSNDEAKEDDHSHSSGDVGTIRNANIQGGTMEGIKSLNVTGDTFLGGGDNDSIIRMDGDVFVHGLVTVSGSVFASGPYVDMSDARVKSDVQSLSSASVSSLEQISKLRGVSYVLNHNGSTIDHGLREERGASEDDHQERRQLGFIAQEVEEVLPELVFTNQDGLKGVQYSRLVPVLVESIKELKAELSELKQLLLDGN